MLTMEINSKKEPRERQVDNELESHRQKHSTSRFIHLVDRTRQPLRPSSHKNPPLESPFDLSSSMGRIIDT